MMQIILDIFYYVGVIFIYFSVIMVFYIFLHITIFGGEFSIEKDGKNKNINIKITLNNNKHRKNEPIR